MAVTQLDLHRQGKAGTLTDAEIASGAAIADTKLAVSYAKADGTRAFTAEVAGVTPTVSASLSTKGYVDAAVQGLSDVHTARAGTNTETLTISGGSVTTIGGTTADSIAANIGEYIYIPNAPASTGAAGGATFTTQPANGLYQVTGNTTNISVTRASEMSGSNAPFGKRVTVVSGATWGGGEYMVTTPGSNAAFTYGSGNIGFGQINGLADVTVGGGGSLVKTGNQLTRAALTGDVTASADANATTIAAAAVTLAKMANLAANSVIANNTGSGATPTALGLTAAATASTAMVRDSSANVRANSLIENFQTITSAAGTTTLTVGSPRVTQITGSTTQTVVMPDATTLVIGQAFTITNRSSGVVTVNMNGGSLLQTMAAGSFLTATVVTIGTSAGTWDAAYTSAGGSGSVTTVSVVSTNGFTGSVANASTTPAITLTTSITGVLKGNGTAISAATVGTDYLAPSSRVTRETPSGTVNGSTTSFGLANTPIAGTEEVYLNGIQQEPGAGNDYTISGATITYLTAPLTGDKIRVSYFK
jgi:hypothetical protein